jgi:hypothetical protein
MKVAIAAALAAAAAVQAKHLSSECLEVVYSRMVELNTHR